MLEGIGFTKKTLFVIHITNVIVACLLIGVTNYCKNSSEITSIPIVGGIIACGVLLLIVSILGIYATYQQHQSFLFYYMVSLIVIFIIQFSVSCACLAVDNERVASISKKAWNKADSSEGCGDIHHAEEVFTCCGYDDEDQRLNISNTDYSTSSARY